VSGGAALPSGAGALVAVEGPALKAVRPKRRKSATRREGRPATTESNQRWAMDLIHDGLAEGRTVRILSVLDVHTRECVALQARQSFRGEDVGAVLSMVALTRLLQPRKPDPPGLLF
jgi:putative transposase